MANTITFYSWLKNQSSRDDVIGDLSNDVKRCRNIPMESEDKDTWISFLTRNRASHEAMEALNEAWDEYSAYSAHIL